MAASGNALRRVFSDYGSGGWGFESSRARQLFQELSWKDGSQMRPFLGLGYYGYRDKLYVGKAASGEASIAESNQYQVRSRYKGNRSSGSALTNDSTEFSVMRLSANEKRCRGPARSGRSRAAGSGDCVAQRRAETCLAGADRAAERGRDRHDGDPAAEMTLAPPTSRRPRPCASTPSRASSPY